MCYKCVNRFTVAFLLIICIQNGGSIKCYQCFLAEHPYYLGEGSQVKTCKDFDYTDTYLIDCPESTFCYKKTVKDYFYKTKYTRDERGCAQQLYRGQKFDLNYGWTADTYVVSNAYQRGCRQVENHGLRTIDVEECYCDSGDYCNYSSKIRSCAFLGPALVIVVFFIK